MLRADGYQWGDPLLILLSLVLEQLQSQFFSRPSIFPPHASVGCALFPFHIRSSFKGGWCCSQQYDELRSRIWWFSAHCPTVRLYESTRINDFFQRGCQYLTTLYSVSVSILSGRFSYTYNYRITHSSHFHAHIRIGCSRGRTNAQDRTLSIYLEYHHQAYTIQPNMMFKGIIAIFAVISAFTTFTAAPQLACIKHNGRLAWRDRVR